MSGSGVLISLLISLHHLNNRERPKSAPYLKLKKTRKRKPFFLKLETTKALKKLKIEKKFQIFFEFFLKFPVSRIVPKKVKGGTLWDFLNIHSNAKNQKLMGGTMKEKIREKISLTVSKKKRKVSECQKKWTLLLWNCFSSHVRGFGCVENEVPSTYGKNC